MLRLSQAQPRPSEEKEGGRGPGKDQSPVRARDEAPRRGRSARGKSSSTSTSVRCSRDEAICQENSRERQFYVVRKDVNSFGPTARCPGCADVSRGVSVKHAHNDECRNRIAKLLMDEGAQRVESFFDRREFEKKPSQEEQLRVQELRQL